MLVGLLRAARAGHPAAFHALALRIVKPVLSGVEGTEGARFGLNPSTLTVYDDADARAALARAMQQAGLDERQSPIRGKQNLQRARAIDDDYANVAASWQHGVARKEWALIAPDG